MKLNDYLSQKKITQTKFAKIIGMSQGNVSEYSRGIRFPSFKTIAKITAATGGLVTANDFVLQESF
ncbi:MAG: helix-turn-helix protein [Bacteroidota bacterium]|jgi:transcriptional regulator with XRE-family HTH domain